MTHHRCQQCGCWLESFCINQFPEPPRFQIGQVARVVWTDETDSERTATAEVLGIVRSNPNWLPEPGWWYVIQVLSQDGQAVTVPIATEEAHESELRPIPEG